MKLNLTLQADHHWFLSLKQNFYELFSRLSWLGLCLFGLLCSRWWCFLLTFWHFEKVVYLAWIWSPFWLEFWMSLRCLKTWTWSTHFEVWSRTFACDQTTFFDMLFNTSFFLMCCHGSTKHSFDHCVNLQKSWKVLKMAKKWEFLWKICLHFQMGLTLTFR